MRQSTTIRRTPFIYLYGQTAGLLEKRMVVNSVMELNDTATLVGDFNHAVQDPMTLDSDAEWHNNHGSDPATHAMSMADDAAHNWDFPRSVEHTLNLVDTVHAVLDGYHPAGEDLIQHDLTANETMVAGQPVYLSSSNTVNLADATTIATGNVIGLVRIGGTANDTVVVQTDGAVYLADWTATIGTANLTPGTYFLDTSSGAMTTTPPTNDGNVVTTLGTALNENTFDIEVNEVAIL